MSKVDKILGFTLAEVLITLGIIGVVTALTIPTIMANIHGKAFKTQFKKSIATVSQAARLSLAHDDYDFSTAEYSGDNSVSNIFLKNLSGITDYGHVSSSGLLTSNNVQYSEILRSQSIDPGDFYIFGIADGSFLIVSDYFNDHISYDDVNYTPCTASFIKNSGYYSYPLHECEAFIDVNGVSGPNKVVSCSSGSGEDCVVKNKDITDIFPIVLYDSIAEPASDAAKYIFNNTK